MNRLLPFALSAVLAASAFSGVEAAPASPTITPRASPARSARPTATPSVRRSVPAHKLRALVPRVSVTASAARIATSSPYDVLTFHRDPQRLGWDSLEDTLTPASVADPSFGPIWNSEDLDSVTLGATNYAPHLYASPLYVDDVLITTGAYAGSHFSAVFAATSNGFVYAICAFDPSNTVSPGTVLWGKSLGRPTPTVDNGVPMGIMGTPVIDLGTTPPRLYVAADVADPSRFWRVFALDLGSGDALPGWPLVVSNTTLGPINENGPATFQSTGAMSQRGGLNLSPDGSLLYIPFGAYGDGGVGWMVTVDTLTPSLASAFSGAPSAVAFANGGMWGSGGPAVDSSGYVYDTTGNSPTDSRESPRVWGNSLLVWEPGPRLQLHGTYTPWNYCQMDANDTDLGGSAPIVVPDLDPTTTGTPRLVAFGGKQGNAYIVDRDQLPGMLSGRQSCRLNPSDAASDGSLYPPDPQPYYDGSPGPLNIFKPYTETCTQGDNARARSTPAYFTQADGSAFLFFSGATKVSGCNRTPMAPSMYKLRVTSAPGQAAYLSVEASDQVLSLLSPGSPLVTSFGSDNPIVWLLDANVYRSAPLRPEESVPHPVLSAVDGATMQLLWQSTPDQLNVGGKYNVPASAHGVVFVGTDRIQAFGLGSTAARARPAMNPGLTAVTRTPRGQARADAAAMARAAASSSSTPRPGPTGATR